jgi:hypothetical protein
MPHKPGGVFLHSRAYTRRKAQRVSPIARRTHLMNHCSSCISLSCLPGCGAVVCLLAPSPSSSPRSSRWLVDARTRGGKPSPLGALYRTRAHPGVLMRRSEHAGKLNAAPPLWCFTVVRAAPRKPTEAPPLTMLSSVESAQGRVVAFSVPPGARRRGFPFGIHTRGPTKPPLGKLFPTVLLHSQDGALPR